MPHAAYAANEVALPGKFADPYVGKVYSDGTTEVISMGFERFESPERLAELMTKDPEHFYLTLGSLLYARENGTG